MNRERKISILQEGGKKLKGISGNGEQPLTMGFHIAKMKIDEAESPIRRVNNNVPIFQEKNSFRALQSTSKNLKKTPSKRIDKNVWY